MTDTTNQPAASYVMATGGSAELKILKAPALIAPAVSPGNVEAHARLLLLQEIGRLRRLVIHYADMAGIPESEVRDVCQL